MSVQKVQCGAEPGNDGTDVAGVNCFLIFVPGFYILLEESLYCRKGLLVQMVNCRNAQKVQAHLCF
jgi:hypothetical protein